MYTVAFSPPTMKPLLVDSTTSQKKSFLYSTRGELRSVYWKSPCSSHTNTSPTAVHTTKWSTLFIQTWHVKCWFRSAGAFTSVFEIHFRL